jgi:hypothetical protein
LKRSPFPVFRRVALALRRALAQGAEGLTPFLAAPGDPGLAITGTSR